MLIHCPHSHPTPLTFKVYTYAEWKNSVFLKKEYLAPLPRNILISSIFYFYLHVDQAIPGQTTVLVVVEGLVKFDGHKAEHFSQNFLLTAEGGTVWKVASDCFRFIEWWKPVYLKLHMDLPAVAHMYYGHHQRCTGCSTNRKLKQM